MLKGDSNCRNATQGTAESTTGLMQGDSTVRLSRSATPNPEYQDQLCDQYLQEGRPFRTVVMTEEQDRIFLQQQQKPWPWLQSQRSETTMASMPGIDRTAGVNPTNCDKNATEGDLCDQVQSQPRQDHASSLSPTSSGGNYKHGSHSAPSPRFAFENHLMGTKGSTSGELLVVRREENKMRTAPILSSAAPLSNSWQTNPCVSSQSSASSISLSSSCSPYSYSSTSPTSSHSSFPSLYTQESLTAVPTFTLFPALPTCTSPTSSSPPTHPADSPPSRPRQRSVPDLRLTLQPFQALRSSPSLSSLSFSSLPFSPSASTQELSSPATTITTLACAYSQPFLSVPNLAATRGGSSLSLLQDLDVAIVNQLTLDMARQRSHSVSSIGSLAKSPSSLLTSLSASVALHDSHQPKSLQDILLLAQSHYISHRYIPALALYKVAAEQHNSIPACGSLFALYTSAATSPGLVKSDTKATMVLMHALRIWMARRWSSKAKGEEDELEEYFAHSRPLRQGRSGKAGKSIPILQRPASMDEWTKQSIAESMASEYRTPRDTQNGSVTPVGQESPNMGLIPASNTQQEDLNGIGGEESQGDDVKDESEAESNVDDDDEEEGGEDEEYDHEAEEEEQRRIGQATEEIEDIVQKLCRMIQKGVLGLQEPVLIEAVSLLRRMEKGLKKEADLWKSTASQSKSLFSSPNTDLCNTGEGLLLTRAFDLSFLDLDTERPNPPNPPTLSDLTNTAIANLSGAERDQDWTWCRAIRIRLMYTLGWVHQQKGEYHYGAQAYGVCSEIESTGKRALDMLQQQASVQRGSCQETEEDASTRNHASGAQSSVQLSVDKTSPVSVKATLEAPTRSRNLDISSPSSLSSTGSRSERRSSSRGASNTFSSLSEVVWGSGLFKTGASSSRASTVSTAPSMISADQPPSIHGRSGTPRLHRSKSASDTNRESRSSKEQKSLDIVKELQQREPKQLPTPQRQGPSRQVSALTLTMAGHQTQLVQCSHCGNKRVQMPLCVCKKARYCNLECRQADMERHCLTGCHASHSTAIHHSIATRSTMDNNDNAPPPHVACTDT